MPSKTKIWVTGSVTIKIGEDESKTLPVEDAKKLYLELREFFEVKHEA